MSVMRRWARRLLEKMSTNRVETLMVIPATGAALVLRERESLQIVLPTAANFMNNPEVRPIALLMMTAAIMLRDHEENLTLFEGMVRAATEQGFPLEVAQRFAGDLINTKASHA